MESLCPRGGSTSRAVTAAATKISHCQTLAQQPLLRPQLTGLEAYIGAGNVAKIVDNRADDTAATIASYVSVTTTHSKGAP